MMILKLLAASFLVFLTCACKDRQTAPNAAAEDSAAIREYFPVYDFLVTEKRNVDSLPVGLKYYMSSNEKKDSGYITHEDFDKLVTGLLLDELKPEPFKRDFRETSFYDQSSKTSTFMYQPLGNTGRVRRVDILTKATDSYDKVSSIYIESATATKDSSVLNKMFWETGRALQLNQQVNFAGRPPIERHIKVVWNNWEEKE